MPFFKRNDDISIWYLDEGAATAPAALLLHGLTCDLHDWSWQVPFLLGLGFRVITPDLRGHGRSSAPAPTPGITSYPGPDARVIDYYPETLTLDIAALMDHLAVGPAVVVSHSMGDLVGYQLATSRPDLVRASVGLDPIHVFDNAMREANAAYFNDPTKCLDIMIAFFDANSYGPTTPANLKSWHGRRAKALDPMVMYALCWGGWGDAQSLGRTEVALEKWSGKLKVPRLTLGASDFQVSVDKDRLPKGSEWDETVVVEGQGHWFHQAESDKVNGLLKAWFEKIRALP